MAKTKSVVQFCFESFLLFSVNFVPHLVILSLLGACFNVDVGIKPLIQSVLDETFFAFRYLSLSVRVDLRFLSLTVHVDFFIFHYFVYGEIINLSSSSLPSLSTIFSLSFFFISIPSLTPIYCSPSTNTTNLSLVWLLYISNLSLNSQACSLEVFKT